MADVLTTTRTFVLDDAVALRLPSDVGVSPGTVFDVERQGETVTLRSRPGTQTWQEFLDELAKLPKPRHAQGRLPVDIPERAGL